MEPSLAPGGLIARAIAAGHVVESAGRAASSNGDPSGVAAVAAPIRLLGGTDPVGAVHAELRGPPVTSSADIKWTAETFASTAALCLLDAGGLAETLRAAGYDGRTGCLGPAALMEVLSAEIARCERHRLALSCLSIDLDGFRQVNDHEGHTTGDGILASVADRLRSVARAYDVVGRLGGDEFIAVLPQTELAGAMRMGERLCAGIAAANRPSDRYPLTVTVGAAEWAPGMSARQTIEAADRALREGKGAGGGRATAGVPVDIGARSSTSGRLDRLTRRLVRTPFTPESDDRDPHRR